MVFSFVLIHSVNPSYQSEPDTDPIPANREQTKAAHVPKSPESETPIRNLLGFESLSDDSILTNRSSLSLSRNDLAFPSNNIACFGRDIYSVIDKYDYIKNSSNSLEEQTSLQNYSSLPQHLYSWLEGAENEIRFYAVKPQSFLTILTGSNLDLKLFDVQGAFFTDENFPSQYVLDITFNFKNSKYLKAGKTLLTLAFGLTDSQSITINDNSLEIKGIKISKEQLYKLLIL